MKLIQMSTIALIAASPLFAEDQRHADAHEHGVGTLDVALDGKMIAMEFHAPGADIVGFEHPATSDDDKAAIQVGVDKLSKPLELFVFPAAANCSVVEAHAELESEEHDDHEEHEEHDDHDDHAKHDEHDDHDDHAEHDEHDEHDEDHAAEHSEFHAEYLLSCDDPAAVTEIQFAYFDVFENAIEVEVQIVSDKGATAFEVEKDTPVLMLKGNL